MASARLKGSWLHAPERRGEAATRARVLCLQKWLPRPIMACWLSQLVWLLQDVVEQVELQ
eukprot:CAMPEP_0179040738 /NCGR_PEP_ID=MMETSP0796-20121207/15798_1 /TAXON_ID=73915 /ORGANISM="Pyrodinium bahamense, Strain pbaha01" /LENGTH=59 /DNA_ID=CAMNT_0020737085 /DNA_START=144 /DNA_END=320 /DNA_ORIENTATION=+